MESNNMHNERHAGLQWSAWLEIEPAVRRYCFLRWGEIGEDVLGETQILFLHHDFSRYQHAQATKYAQLRAKEAARNLGLYRAQITLEEIIGTSQEPITTENNVYDVLEKKERANALLHAITYLSRTQKHILWLRYWQDKTIDETSDVLGVKIEVAYRREQDALRLLRRFLGDSYRHIADACNFTDLPLFGQES